MSDAPDAKQVAVTAQALGSPPELGCADASASGRDYWFCATPRSWQSARSMCQSIGLDLASIGSATENQFIAGRVLLPSWIGASDTGAEGAWRWADTGAQFWQGGASGSAVGGAYKSWLLLEPNNFLNQDCGTTSALGLWTDESCSTPRPYVCEGVVDLCPADPNKTQPGQCGCGVADTDSDADGTADCNDGCPTDAGKTAPGQCGCGVSDADADGDGPITCDDECPSDATKLHPGDCGCADAPAAAGTACDDGLCAANVACDGQGSCGAPAECGVPDTACSFAIRADTPYWVCRNDRSYADARARCQSVGMELAAVESAGEDAFITGQTWEHSWLGGSDAAQEGEWTWGSTGRSFWTGGLGGSAPSGAYANWELLQPSDGLLGGHDRLVKDPPLGQGKWETRSCSDHEAFVCEGLPAPPVDLQACVDAVAARPNLTGAAQDLAYQVDLLRACAAPGDPICLQELRARVNLDYNASARSLVSQTRSPAQFLALDRDRARKAKAFEADAALAAELCAADADEDLVPNGRDQCPGTPPLTPTDDAGCTDDTLPPAPPAADVATALAAMGFVFNAACSGAAVPPRPTMGGFYKPANPEHGTYIFVGRARAQPEGCPVWYHFEIEELVPDPSPPGVRVQRRYGVAFKDTEELTALFGNPVPVPHPAIQFHALPTDPGTRGQLGSVGGSALVRMRIKLMNGAGMQSAWSQWKLVGKDDCPPLGIHCP